VKIEQALRVLPPLEALMPLRGLLLSSSPTQESMWSRSGQNLTIGKVDVAAAEMRQQLAPALRQIGAHLSTLFDAYVLALEGIERGDVADAVTHLLYAGEREAEVGRLPQAMRWYNSALELAEALPSRRPEVETLLAMGRLARDLGDYEHSARRCQRGLTLAEAEFDSVGAIDACLGLGIVAVEQGAWAGAQAWYARGLRIASEVGDERRIGHLHHGLGELARRKGDRTAAEEALRAARERFEALNDAREMSRVLTTQGLLEADVGSAVRAANMYREALAWTHRESPDAALEVFIRISFAKLHIEVGHFLEAEEELRRAEQLAIASHLIRRLVQIYTLFGRLRGLQGDESGFVFFEQSIQLARLLEGSPVAEAQAYHEYGMFRLMLREHDESLGYLERARELFELVGASAELERVKAEIRSISA
jgi:tetratricopeptide (TPR) repeat protein